MSLLTELHEDLNQQHSTQQKNEIDNKILKRQDFIQNYKISKWHIIVVDFGEHLLKEKNLVFRDTKDSFTVEEMKNIKGLNFGEYEFCYEHMALILSDIHHKYIDDLKHILVAPISSTKRKNSILLEKRFNSFLSNDSYILLDHVKHISLERINIKKSESIFKKQFKPIAPKIINDVKLTLKKIFDIA